MGAQRNNLDRLCCYATRPAIAEQRLSLTNQGKVRKCANLNIFGGASQFANIDQRYCGVHESDYVLDSRYSDRNCAEIPV